eukprot:TRINITY_DN69285_c0_g1_i1.p1 TRINITY_DN69285_c0_g1~~TRINITY_DN69285_c0_g1_i1.p1  ORF type:complete len:376 (-),score=22.10 TRINITY_DN69285_c0_g1_i1:94-1221(-)
MDIACNGLGFHQDMVQQLNAPKLGNPARLFCQRMCQHAMKPQQDSKVEKFTLSEDEAQGSIVVAGEHGTALGLDNKCVIVNGTDSSSPDSWERFYFSVHSRKDTSASRMFRKIQSQLRYGLLSPQHELKQQFWDLVRLLQAGTYHIRVHHNVLIIGTIPLDPPHGEHTAHDGWWMHFTQCPAIVSEKRVEEYMSLIKRGFRPLCVGVSSYPWTPNALRVPQGGGVTRVRVFGATMFLIDGHHKYEAYKRVGILPSFLQICRQDPLPGASFAALISSAANHTQLPHWWDRYVDRYYVQYKQHGPPTDFSYWGRPQLDDTATGNTPSPMTTEDVTQLKALGLGPDWFCKEAAAAEKCKEIRFPSRVPFVCSSSKCPW